MRLKLCIAGLALAAAMFISSCSTVPFSDYRFLGRFEKGTNRAIIDSLKNEDPKYLFDYTADSVIKATHVDCYYLYTTTYQPLYARILGLPIARDYYDLIVFAYQNNDLIYCGCLEDFKRSTNPEIHAIGLKLATSLKGEIK